MKSSCRLTSRSRPDNALDHAIAIAKWYQSRVTALHVIRVPLVPELPASILAVGAAGGTAVITSTMQACEADVRTWVEPAVRAGIKTDVFVNHGNAARRILEHAQSWRTDLIVLGTHGLSGVDHAMLGSVTEKVLRKADCPVMTVPPAARTTREEVLQSEDSPPIPQRISGQEAQLREGIEHHACGSSCLDALKHGLRQIGQLDLGRMIQRLVVCSSFRDRGELET